MKTWYGSLLKVLGIIITVVVVIIAIFVIAINIICDDEKIREIINSYAEENLSVVISADNYSLKPLSRFPSLTLAVDDLVITTDKVKDSLYTPEAHDTLLVVKSADVAMSALPLLKGRFIFAGIYIDSIAANYTLFQDTTSNWDLFIEESGVDTVSFVVEDEEESSYIAGIGIKQFIVSNAKIRYDDRLTKQLLDIEKGDIILKGGMMLERGLFLDVDLQTNGVNYISQNERLVNDLDLGLRGQLFVKGDSSSVVLNNTKFSINNISFTCDGSIKQDSSAENSAMFDLKYSMDLPELSELWKIVPHRYSQFAEGINVGGMVVCNGSFKGLWNESSMPRLRGYMRTENISFSHKDLPGKIDTLDLNILLDMDLNNVKEQKLLINNVAISGTGISAKVNGVVRELMGDPIISVNGKVNVDAEKMLTLFPDTLGIEARGGIDGSLRTNFKLSHITAGNYGKIKAGGRVTIPEFYVNIPKDSISLYIDGASIFLGSGMVRKGAQVDTTVSPLGGSIRYKSFRAELKRGNVFKSDSMRISLRSAQVSDTNAVVPLQASLMWQNLRAERRDSAWLVSKYMNVSAKIGARAGNNRVPELKANLDSDSLIFTPFQDRLNARKIGAEITAWSTGKKSDWILNSIFRVRDYDMFTMHYPLRIRGKLLKLSTNSYSVTVDATDMKVGSSDFEIYGNVGNVWNWLKSNDTVSMRLKVNSKRININQLLAAMEQGEAFRLRLDSIISARRGELTKDSEARMLITTNEAGNTDIESIDTTSSVKLNHVYVLPENYRVDCTLKADRMVFGKWRMKSVNGLIDVNDGVLKLSEMSLNSDIGNILARGVYTAEDTTKAFAGFAMTLNQVQIGNLLDIVPQFDTVMPMLTSLSGSVNVDFAVAGNWDSDMRVDMNSLNGAACIDGKDLVLMDGETFSTIAKMLKFKNRKRNLIDSLSVSLSMSNGMVDIYPFVFSMDRYRAAVGGKQGLDMTYQYHISVLDSPIPFKFGLTIKGNADDMKFKITKAKYKDLMKPTSKYNVKQVRLDLKDKISGFLDEIKDQTYSLPKFQFEEDAEDEEMSDEELEKALEKIKVD